MRKEVVEVATVVTVVTKVFLRLLRLLRLYVNQALLTCYSAVVLGVEPFIYKVKMKSHKNAMNT